jgi:hypothetical protein
MWMGRRMANRGVESVTVGIDTENSLFTLWIRSHVMQL